MRSLAAAVHRQTHAERPLFRGTNRSDAAAPALSCDPATVAGRPSKNTLAEAAI
jgi:hypothetical protein